MRIAIFENIMTPGGHEVDFDRLLAEEFTAFGHDVTFYVPEGFEFTFDYKLPVHRLSGGVVTYTGARGLEKLWRSAKREYNRLGWYGELYGATKAGEIDAIIVPTSTYRYLRALSMSPLKNSPVPVIFILHGINPGEKNKFFDYAKKIIGFKNIKLAVITFGEKIFGESLENIFCVLPPTYIPRDIKYEPKKFSGEKLTLGFFGQYRREKNLRVFLDSFLSGRYSRPVKLIVQGSTMLREDEEDFERIIKEYGENKNISFIHRALIGADWQRAVTEVDALVMPYSSPRYKYHWGGMLFTAIGSQKPVIVSDDMNPEVFEKYDIGVRFKSGDMSSLSTEIEKFVNSFDSRSEIYYSELNRAASDFSPKKFSKKILSLAEVK